MLYHVDDYLIKNDDEYNKLDSCYMTIIKYIYLSVSHIKLCLTLLKKNYNTITKCMQKKKTEKKINLNS